MEIGYMTNGYGLLVGAGGGVTSVKDIRYLSLVDEEEVISKISHIGYRYIEMFDGNLDKFDGNEEQLEKIFENTGTNLLGVYVGANYIYQDAFEDELAHIEETMRKAQRFGAKHLVLGGGAIRATGNIKDDYIVLAKNLDRIAEVAKKYDLVASYHPHLGSAVEKPEEIDQLFSLTNISFCPDIAHLAAGGGDALDLIKKYYDRIVYVHFKDLKDGKFMPLGQGDISLVEIIEFLQEKKYQGDYLVEIDGYDGSPDEACQTSYDFMKKYLG